MSHAWQPNIEDKLRFSSTMAALRATPTEAKDQ
jgi:hypothetical protein